MSEAEAPDPRLLSTQLLSSTYSQFCAEKSDLNYQLNKLETQRQLILDRIDAIDRTVDALNEATPIIKSIEAQIDKSYAFKYKDLKAIKVAVIETKPSPEKDSNE